MLRQAVKDSKKRTDNRPFFVRMVKLLFVPKPLGEYDVREFGVVLYC